MSTTKKIIKAITAVILVILGLLVVGVVTLAILFKWQDRTNGTIVSSRQERTYLLHIP